MTNFSDFFPAAGGGGGGFTKMNKYSTNRALNDATHKTPSPALVDGQLLAAPSSGQTSFSWRLDATAQDQIDRTSTVNGLVDYTFTHSSTVHTITANTGAGYYTAQTVTFTPALTANITYGGHIDFSAPTFITVNPATDLGLEDGASLGYLLAGGNATGVLRGTSIISNASTDLVLTPGVSSGAASTITGGLTLTSANGSTDNSFNYADLPVGSARHRGFGGGQGVNGYGVGNQYYDTRDHGFGGYGKDGAILLYY